jgi:dihydroorotate dehydrogenase
MRNWFIRLIIKRIYRLEDERLSRNVMGLTFPNPIGLGAGFDKNATYIEEIEALGFGFTEVGTVTPMPQPGNDKPRLFRLPKDEALINRMGFNNVGADLVAARLKRLRSKTKMVIGVNIGKNKITPNEKAVNDYVICFQKLFDVADYFVVNVSSPNTPGLRELQEKEPLKNLLNAIKIKNEARPKAKPLLLKIAPDLSAHQLDDIVEICMGLKIDGIIATNTTISREGLQTKKKTVEKYGAGGLSGKAVKKRSTEVIRYLHQKTNGKIPIIGVGGIASPKDALEKLEAGASLVQLYTGFIYEGPTLIREINEAILKKESKAVSEKAI